MFLHLCVTIYHYRIFLDISIPLNLGSICISFSFLILGGGIFFIHLSLYIIVPKFQMKTMLTKFSCSCSMVLIQFFPSLASYFDMRSILHTSFFFLWLFLNIGTPGFYYLMYIFEIPTFCVWPNVSEPNFVLFIFQDCDPIFPYHVCHA